MFLCWLIARWQRIFTLAKYLPRWSDSEPIHLIENESVAIEGRTTKGTPVTIDTISGDDLLGWS